MSAHVDLAALIAAGGGDLKLRQAVVSAVVSGSCTLHIAGSSVAVPGVPRLASYSPTAGDTVMVLVASAASMLILGAIHA